MPLSQALFNRVASIAAQVSGETMEEIVYHAKASAQAIEAVYTRQGKFEQYSDHVTALHSLVPEGKVQREDRRLRLATAVITWVPSRYDEVVRADGSRWRVVDIEGGDRRVYYFMQCHKVGGPHG